MSFTYSQEWHIGRTHAFPWIILESLTEGRLFTDLAEYSSSFSQLKVLLSGSDIWDIWSQKIISKERKRTASQSSVLVKLDFPSSRSEDSCSNYVTALTTVSRAIRFQEAMGEARSDFPHFPGVWLCLKLSAVSLHVTSRVDQWSPNFDSMLYQ